MSTQAFRLATGGRIDRSRKLQFSFDGKIFEGHPGDTVASALLANGVSVVGRSFKYHRPRGIMAAGVEDPNAWLQLGSGGRSTPNVLATVTELHDRLVARSCNSWPNLNFDMAAFIDRFGAMFPAGFYYKTFMGPGNLWTVYERFIRRLAGVGVAPDEIDPDHYEQHWDHPDILIVGGGPAGLSAALAASRSGARTVLVDERTVLGGTLLWNCENVAGARGDQWAMRAVDELGHMPNVRLLSRTTAFGYYDSNYVLATERGGDHLGGDLAPERPRESLWKFRPKQVVLATGAHERPLVFEGNDRPGVMLASAARAYLNHWAVRSGARVLVFTNNDSAYATALDMSAANVEVAGIVDSRPDGAGPIATQTKAAGIPVWTGRAVVRTVGRTHVRAVEIAAIDEKGRPVGRSETISCDSLCISGGWNPTVQLFAQSGGSLRYDAEKVCLVPDRSVQATQSAGAACGTFDLRGCLAEGWRAGLNAAASCGFMRHADDPEFAVEPLIENPVQPLWSVSARRPGAKQFVDYFGDVTAADVSMAAREGFVSVEHLKRYTTAGMGIDQGKTTGLNAIALLGESTGSALASIGTTTYRPPYTPVTMGTLAGRRRGMFYAPLRRTSIDGWHDANGAVFEDFGQWRRPQWYRGNGRTVAEAINRECLAVRKDVGLIDVSTLGKIELVGPDAVTILDFAYSNLFATLPVGRCRYGLMLRDNGMVFDDGVTARLSDHRYLMSTTTGGASGVFGWLEDWIQSWPHLRVHMTSVTTQWVAIAVTGPKARDLLASLESDIDFRAAAFPFLSVREGKIEGVKARVLSVSFTGEFTFEVQVPATYGMALWERLINAGQRLGIVPVGVDAMDQLRMEKGHIIVGRDVDGTATPADLGLAALVSKKKPDWFGKRFQTSAEAMRPDRLQLVGLLAEDPRVVIPEGAQILPTSDARIPSPSIGHVTSSGMSPTLDRSIAMAMLAGGRVRYGESVVAWSDGRAWPARVAASSFYDPQGLALRG